MNALRWILIVFMVAVLVMWLWRTRGARRSKGLGLLILGSIVQGLLGFFYDSATGIALFLLALALTVWGGVLVVREARAVWRADMERVKHL